MSQYSIGIHIGEDRIAYGLFDGNGACVTRRAHETDLQLPPEALFDHVAKQVQHLVAEGDIKKEQLLGVGIGVPSIVLKDGGFIQVTQGIPKLNHFAAKQYLEQKLDGVRIVIDHCANAGALAEHRFGAGREHKNMIYCHLSAGIASGAIINNKLFKGEHSLSGITGHMIITPGEGMPCICGNNGCFMSYCAGSMIVRHVESWLGEGAYSAMTEMAGGANRINPKHISQAYERGDEMATRAIEQMSNYLGIWLYNLYLTHQADYFVLGGGLTKMGRKLIGRIRKVFDTYHHTSPHVEIALGQLGEDRDLIGAAQLLL